MICSYIRWRVFIITCDHQKNLFIHIYFIHIYTYLFCRNRKKNENVNNMLTCVLHYGSILKTMDD